MTSRRCIGGRSTSSSTRAIGWPRGCDRPVTPTESARVKALPKPSAPAWALNQVYWHAREDYDRLIAAGDRLRALQQQMLGGRAVDPRESMQERQAAVRQVVDRAARFLADAGHPVTDATRQRLNVTADALATWGSQPQGYVHGRLDRDIDPPGFAALASLGPPALRLVKSGRGAADVPSPVPAEIEQPQSRPTPAARGAPRGHKGTPEPTAAEKAAARRAAEKAAQEAERAREAEHRRLARVLQDAEREVRGRATARDRAASALSGAAAGRPEPDAGGRLARAAVGGPANPSRDAPRARTAKPRLPLAKPIEHTPRRKTLPHAPAATWNGWRRST